MTTPRNLDGLEIDQDLAFERRSWRVERLGWALMALLLLAALLGLLGAGPLSTAEVRTADAALVVRYERFVHREAPTELELHLVPVPSPADGLTRLWVGRDLAGALEVRSISPEPRSVEATADRVLYALAASGPGTVRVRLDVEPRRAGRHSGRLGIVGGGEVALGQFVYP